MKTDKPESYSEKLPRRIKRRGPCAAMDEDGVRCDNPATVEQHYHGALAEKARWVAVFLCDYHCDIGLWELEGKLSNREWHKQKRAGKLMFPGNRQVQS